jgi:hypothetical protein
VFAGRPQYLRVDGAWVRVPERGAAHFACGHPRVRSNIYVGRYADGGVVRQCRACALVRAKRRYQPHPRTDGLFCPNGHERTAANLYPSTSPVAGRCRTCAINRARRQRERQKEIVCSVAA